MTEEFNNKNEIIEEKTNEVHEDKTVKDPILFRNEEDIRTNKDTAVAVENNSRLYVILGWISAALTVFISPLFAIAGVTFGILLNRQAKGSGNALIITNIALALINIVFSIILYLVAGNMIFGY
ncbi:MAG: hypothetical protein ACOYWZ_19865 [Bacillota bacterium]